MDIKIKFNYGQYVYFMGSDRQMHSTGIIGISIMIDGSGIGISYLLNDPSDEYSTTKLPESALYATSEELIEAIKENFKAAYPADLYQ